jgi:signal transduction histidine kinase
MDRFIGSNENNLLVMGLRATAVEEGALTTEVETPDGRRQYVVGRYLPEHQLCVLLSVSLESIGQAVNVLQRQLTWVGVVLLGVSLLLAWAFSGWFTRPITAISTAARQIARGNYDVRLPVTQKDEIGVLTEDFNTMAREVGKADAMQKDLLASVSHDLRTPLTLIKGYAETIRDLNGDDKTKRDAQLDIIISESDRLGALVGSVTELSRLDAGTEKFQPVTFDISDFCEELSYRYADVCSKNGYRLLLENPGEDTVAYFHWVVEGLRIATAHKEDTEKQQALAELLALADTPELSFLKESSQ